MRRFLMGLTLVLVVFVAVFRQRLFLWDPLAKVTRHGVAVPEARVQINFSNDILLTDATGQTLVQNWNLTAIRPAKLICLQRMACLTDADHASGESLGLHKMGVQMTDRRIVFPDENGAVVEVVLR